MVCVESLAIEHLLKNHCLAKAIADVGWGELLRQLAYKARWYGRTVVAINRSLSQFQAVFGLRP